MLQAARQQLAQGVDVVAGLVETHNRTETARLLNRFGNPVVAPDSASGSYFERSDLDAAGIHPQLMLVDELAHSNVPGSRHPKRWQDVEELLAAGIDGIHHGQCAAP